MKKCKLCEVEKDFSEFYKDKSTQDGYTRRCKPCCKSSNASTYSKNKDKYQKRNAEWYEKNKEKHNQRLKENYVKNKEQHNKRSADWYLKNKEKVSKHRKDKWELDEEYRERRKEKIKEWRDKNKIKTREYVRKYMAKWRKENPKQMKAVNKLNHAVYSGKIQRLKYCQLCGDKGKIEAHHHDYDKPLEVLWVCKKCHVFIHHRVLKAEK